MNKEIKKEWVEALLSGEYKQGMNNLRSKEKGQKIERFCCLGVLCDIYDSKLWKKDTDVYGSDVYDHDGDNGYLSKKVAKKIGIGTETMEELVDLNDQGKTFKFIAKHIKASP